MKLIKKALLMLPLIAISLAVSSCSGNTEIYQETQIVNDYHNYKKVTSKYSFYDVAKNNGTTAIKSIGEVPILVIPVAIRGYEVVSTKVVKEDIRRTFFGDTEETSWESVSSFYTKSSYDKCHLTGEVTDWFDCGLNPRQIYEKGHFEPGSRESSDGGSWYILEKAIEWYKETYKTDGKQYDTDGDGYLDAVWLVYGCPDYTKAFMIPDTFWAFTYYDKNNKGKQDVDNPVPYLYSWASYDFIYNVYGENGIDAHTFIHETGHLFGLDDYYDYDGRKSPSGGVDMMDMNIIDHCAYSKFGLGWVTPTYFEGNANVSLTPFVDSGECLLIGYNWNQSAFDEYFLVELYSPTGLNYYDSIYGYTPTKKGFSKVGVRIYHVDSRLAYEKESGKYSYTDEIVEGKKTIVAASNTGSYSMESSDFNLLALIDATGNARGLYSENVIDNSALFAIGQTFTVNNYKYDFVDRRLNDGSRSNIKIEIGTLTDNFVNIGVGL